MVTTDGGCDGCTNNSLGVHEVVTVGQILALMQPPQNFEDDRSFTAEDFGLTEDDGTPALWDGTGAVD